MSLVKKTTDQNEITGFQPSVRTAPAQPDLNRENTSFANRKGTVHLFRKPASALSESFQNLDK
jgi:hypothetical protein